MSALSDLLRYTGIATALVGTVVVAPHAFLDILARSRARAIRVVRAAQQAARRLLRRPQGQPFEARAVSATLSGGGHAHASVTSTVRRADVPVKEQIDRLREEIADVRNSVSSVQADLNAERQQREAGVAAAQAAVAAKAAEIHGRIDTQEAQSQELDTRGLPPVAFGIVLSGVPDELAHFAWLGWLFLAGALWLTLRGCRQVYRHLRSAGRPGSLPA